MVHFLLLNTFRIFLAYLERTHNTHTRQGITRTTGKVYNFDTRISMWFMRFAKKISVGESSHFEQNCNMWHVNRSWKFSCLHIFQYSCLTQMQNQHYLSFYFKICLSEITSKRLWETYLVTQGVKTCCEMLREMPRAFNPVSAYCAWEAAGDGSSPCHSRVGDQDGIPGFWLQSGPVPALIVSWGVIHSTKEVSLFLCL